MITGLVIIVVALFIFLDFAFKDMCGNDVYQSVLSPNKKQKVIVFERDCGATTGFTTQISIIPENEQLANESGNIFTADGHPDDNPTKVSWINDNTIEIQENFAKSGRRKNTFKDINIKYTKY